MTNLICDICGTTYPDTDEKCPTCGYSRGLMVFTPYDGQAHSEHEKVRGGRYSKKNVQKRLQRLAEAAAAAAEAEPEVVEQISAPEIEADMSAAIAAMAAPQPEPDVPAAAPEMEPAAEQAQQMPEETAATAPEAVEEPGEPGQNAESCEEIPPEVPEEPAEPTPEEVEEEQEKAVLAVYRRDVRLNLLLFFAGVVFLISSVYLVMNYGIPYLKQVNWPAQVVTEAPTAAPTVAQTEMPTEAPTQAPTEAPTAAPTEAPTDPPTEAPTQAPTEAPTDIPTEAPTEKLAIPLTLNYYELTFRGGNQGVQLEVEGYANEDITWTSDDPTVATVSNTGKVISVGNGTTKIHGSYGGHTVSCIIYCNFS